MAHETPFPTLLSTPEAAKVLGVMPRTLARWRCERVGPVFLKIGRLIKYSTDDLRAYLDGRRRGT